MFRDKKGKLIEIKQPYVVVRPNLGRSPYEAEFDPKLYSRIYDEGWAAVKDKDGLRIGTYIRTDNQKTRNVRRFDEYKKAGYK